MKILTFGASNSATSINKTLAQYTASLVDGGTVDLIDINDFEMPLYSPEREAQLGQPEQAKRFYQKITEADAIVISFAEHNGSYTAAYKNLFDWTSRIDMKVFQNKPMLLLATSPGPGGANTVLTNAVNSAPYFAGVVKGSVSVPSFYDNFDADAGEITDPVLKDKLQSAAAALVS